MATRELTAAERAAIKQLVVTLCANYDGGYKLCAPLDCACVMLGKCDTGGGYCKYFIGAVLPNDPTLAVSLLGGGATRPCALCGAAFPVDGKRAYCSAACAENARLKRQRGYMRKRQGDI